MKSNKKRQKIDLRGCGADGRWDKENTEIGLGVCESDRWTGGNELGNVKRLLNGC